MSMSATQIREKRRKEILKNLTAFRNARIEVVRAGLDVTYIDKLITNLERSLKNLDNGSRSP